MKKNVKIFVNLLTSSRLIATFFMPLMFSTLPAHIFILITGLICLTDLIDGKIARKNNINPPLDCQRQSKGNFEMT